MSLSYADFINYLEKDTSYNGSPSGGVTPSNFSNALPNEFQVLEETNVPLLQTADNTFQDFIIIAEFSEMEGPTPLCTIPIDAPSKTDINLNSLAVHLMSTDYQVNTVGHFKVCEDTQVFRTNVFKNVHVFMQYFTLYDLKARGFVRPFCFGYVSKDHIKVDRNVSKFASEFDKITNILKHTNRQWFSAELQRYLLRLKNAKEEYINLKSQNSWQTRSLSTRGGASLNTDEEEEPGMFSLDDSSEFDNISLNQIAHQYTEIETILQTVKNTPVDPTSEHEVKILSHHIQHLHPKALLKSTIENLRIHHSISEETLNAGSSDVDSLNLVHPLKQKGEPLRPLTTLGGLGVIILVWRLMRLELEKRPDYIFSEIDLLAKTFEKHCRTLNGSKSPLFDVSIKTVLSDRTVLMDDSVEMGGGFVYDRNTNSISNIITKESHNNDANDDDYCSADDCEDEHFELLLYDNLCQVIEKIHSSVAIVPDNKSGSYHSLSSESDVQMPSRHASGNENESSSYNSAIGSVESQKTFYDEISSFKSIPLPTTDPCLQSLHVSSESYASSSGTITSSQSDFNPNTITPTPTLPSTTTSTPAVPPVYEYHLTEKEDVREHSSIIPSLSLFDRQSDTRCSVSSYSSSDDDYNFTGSSSSDFSTNCGSIEMIEKIQWYVAMSKKLTKGQPGYGILKFFRHFHQAAHHVLYSIVIGRPVIFCGSESFKSRISQILTALIPLVPCFPEKSWKLLRWHRGILVPAHFKQNSFKLIGLCIPERLVVHDLMSPKDVNSVTILNVETKTILGPAYTGVFFSNFEQKCQKYFQDDVSLMGFLGCLFTEVETKVFLYKSLQKDGMKSSDIFRQLDVKGADADIIKHVARLVPELESIVEIF